MIKMIGWTIVVAVATVVSPFRLVSGSLFGVLLVVVLVMAGTHGGSSSKKGTTRTIY